MPWEIFGPKSVEVAGDWKILPNEELYDNVNKNPTDATVYRYLFTAKLLYVYRVSQHPSSGVLKTVTAASGTGHNTGTATPLQRGLIGASRSDHVGGE